MKTTQAVTSSDSAVATIVTGANEASPIPAIVLGSPSADAGASQTAKPSRSQRTAANIAATQTRTLAAQPAPPAIVAPTEQPGLELSSGAATLSPDEIAAAFMGKPLEKATEEVQNGESETTEGNIEQGTEAKPAETETETDTPQGTETETETHTETASPIEGITKELTEKGVSAGLNKRIAEVFKQNAERGELLKRQEFKLIVLPPSHLNPLSTITNEAEVDAAVDNMQMNARKTLRLLNRMGGVGGTWAEGTTQQRELSAEEVENAIDYYEDQAARAPAIGAAQKQYLKTIYADIAGLEIPPDELINPKVATRESRFAHSVPQISANPEYLRLLADAKFGREMREKKAGGIQFLEVDPAKAKATTPPAKTVTAPVKHVNSSTASPKAGAPVRGADSGESLEQLRTKAENGSQEAQNKIMRMFMAPTSR